MKAPMIVCVLIQMGKKKKAIKIKITLAKQFKKSLRPKPKTFLAVKILAVAITL